MCISVILQKGFGMTYWYNRTSALRTKQREIRAEKQDEIDWRYSRANHWRLSLQFHCPPVFWESRQEKKVLNVDDRGPRVWHWLCRRSATTLSFLDSMEVSRLISGTNLSVLIFNGRGPSASSNPVLSCLVLELAPSARHVFLICCDIPISHHSGQPRVLQ